jgi:hypothetical protein
LKHPVFIIKNYINLLVKRLWEGTVVYCNIFPSELTALQMGCCIRKVISDTGISVAIISAGISVLRQACVHSSNNSSVDSKRTCTVTR